MGGRCRRGGDAPSWPHSAGSTTSRATSPRPTSRPWSSTGPCDLVGPLDTLVANHARSSTGTLAETTVDELDASWAVNVRASLLLVQAFAAIETRTGPAGCVLFTSGQHSPPMASELPYAVTKGAIQQMTLTLSDALIDQGITVNAINPGPVDTGWATPSLAEQVGRALPRGRWTTPVEVADVVAWLISDDASADHRADHQHRSRVPALGAVSISPRPTRATTTLALWG